jgi:hypothetical protein
MYAALMRSATALVDRSVICLCYEETRRGTSELLIRCRWQYDARVSVCHCERILNVLWGRTVVEGDENDGPLVINEVYLRSLLSDRSLLVGHGMR